MTTPNPVDLDALDALRDKWLSGQRPCPYPTMLMHTYPALSAELRRLRGLVREYAEARQAWDYLPSDNSDDATESVAEKLERAEEALYAAGKEIAK